MADIKLTSEEADVLRLVLTTVVVKMRTGEVGIVHGMERFVSTHRTLKKAERIALNDAARKLGLTGGIKEYEN